MKKLAIAVAVGLTLSACSTFKSDKGITPSVDAVTPVKDQKVSTAFVDEGVKLTYTMGGKLDYVEVVGQAPAWKRNVDIIAEADAMDKLVKFVHGKSVSSDRRMKIISRALDKATDITNNKFKSMDGTIQTDSKEIEAEMRGSNNGEENQKDNTAYRKAQVVDETLVNTVTTIQAQGFLVGVRKISDAVKDDGRIYIATYRWSIQDMDAAIQVRNAMRKAQ